MYGMSFTDCIGFLHGDFIWFFCLFLPVLVNTTISACKRKSIQICTSNQLIIKVKHNKKIRHSHLIDEAIIKNKNRENKEEEKKKKGGVVVLLEKCGDLVSVTCVN